MKTKATRRLEAARLEAMVDAAWKESADAGKSLESQAALEKAKIKAVLESVDSKESRISTWFQEYYGDILIHGTIVTLVGMGIASGIGTYKDNVEQTQLQNDTLTVGQEYSQWRLQTPQATEEDEEKFFVDAVSKNIENAKEIGLAFEHGDNDTLCVWKKGLQDSSINKAISFSSNGTESNLNTSANCSSMEVVYSPDGEHLTQNPGTNMPNGTTENGDAANQGSQSESAPENSSLPIILGATGAILALGVVGGGSMVAVKKISASKRRKQNFTDKWDALMKRHDVVRREWASYELDPMKMLDYPVLSDMREKVTVELHAALRKANGLRPVNSKSMALEDADNSKYEAAVEALETAFHVAESEAKRVQWTKFNMDEQKRLTTAKTLLNFVLDGTANEFERQSAYKRLQKEIAGLINIPTPTLAAIEESFRSMIEA